MADTIIYEKSTVFKATVVARLDGWSCFRDHNSCKKLQIANLWQKLLLGLTRTDFSQPVYAIKWKILWS